MFASMVSWIASQVLLDLALLLSGLVSGRAELLRSLGETALTKRDIASVATLRDVLGADFPKLL